MNALPSESIGHEMRVLRQRRLRWGADAHGRRVCGAKLGVFALEILQLAKELVVFLVGDGRAVEHVVLVRRALDTLAEIGCASGEFVQRVG